LRREWLIALTGLGAGTAIGMWITDRFEWFSFVSLAILVTIYFYLKQLRRKKTGTPETDERIRKNAQRAALYTLLVLIGIGILVLGLTTTPDQRIPVKYIAVYVLFGLFTLSAVLSIVKRR
jgi:uncharacterized membrane protein YhaH (DUF805 family)